MPNSATPTLNELAKRLLAYEAGAGRRAGANSSAAFRACEKLRQPLGQLLGIAGFRALFSRALALASDGVPWLRALHIKADGCLEGLSELEAQLEEDGIAAGELVLVARLLELLVTFIGPALTLRFIQDAWPKGSFDDLDFDKGQGP
ncbi:MAG TPA: hypothetical protein VGQ99_06040 [Tepidisphaeraceae bacterium]|jgi:hypothetical protein|nr:hypothetical protein [Tepidisphaeraceae bacterium]